ncbi:hypothetical protein C4D60_Mb07t04380 [Musa balbisiana]|uniref:Uncharacterized protein n=1 Tax=Musa balbisiana TaxID=52838 RepID=A0A4S8JCY4_MUSBA|nr:hypothetical protein C4D60_Mb07t04380 [Musa balbisiana]
MLTITPTRNLSPLLLESSGSATCIPEEFVLVAPDPGQGRMTRFPRGFDVGTLDALEAGLRLPASPHHCLLSFLVAPILALPSSVPRVMLFAKHYPYPKPLPLLFRLCKGWGAIFCRPWQVFVSLVERLGVGIRWAARAIDNTAPSLNDEECRGLERLREILPGSQAIRAMNEQWLAEAGLSPAAQGMFVAGDPNVFLVLSGRDSLLVLL